VHEAFLVDFAFLMAMAYDLSYYLVQLDGQIIQLLLAQRVLILQSGGLPEQMTAYLCSNARRFFAASAFMQ
jgi:hypothetical protein